MSYTKTPWYIDPDDPVEIYSKGNNVATAWTASGISGIEAKANARLIAAAPEMLELLEDFVQSICSGDSMRQHQEWARELIAKVKGDSE